MCAESVLILGVCENRDGWLVAWGLCGCMLIRFSGVWLLPRSPPTLSLFRNYFVGLHGERWGPSAVIYMLLNEVVPAPRRAVCSANIHH